MCILISILLIIIVEVKCKVEIVANYDIDRANGTCPRLNVRFFNATKINRKFGLTVTVIDDLSIPLPEEACQFLTNSSGICPVPNHALYHEYLTALNLTETDNSTGSEIVLSWASTELVIDFTKIFGRLQRFQMIKSSKLHFQYTTYTKECYYIDSIHKIILEICEETGLFSDQQKWTCRNVTLEAYISCNKISTNLQTCELSVDTAVNQSFYRFRASYSLGITLTVLADWTDYVYFNALPSVPRKEPRIQCPLQNSDPVITLEIQPEKLNASYKYFKLIRTEVNKPPHIKKILVNAIRDRTNEQAYKAEHNGRYYVSVCTEQGCSPAGQFCDVHISGKEFGKSTIITLSVVGVIVVIALIVFLIYKKSIPCGKHNETVPPSVSKVLPRSKENNNKIQYYAKHYSDTCNSQTELMDSANGAFNGDTQNPYHQPHVVVMDTRQQTYESQNNDTFHMT